TTPSIKPSFLLKSDTPPARGDYVLFTRDDRYLADTPVRVTKRLACMPGDQLDTDYPWYYCNDQLIATALTHDGKGKPLAHFEYSGQIPAGQAFVVGDTNGSYDSRYWGFIALEQLHTVRP